MVGGTQNTPTVLFLWGTFLKLSPALIQQLLPELLINKFLIWQVSCGPFPPRILESTLKGLKIFSRKESQSARETSNYSKHWGSRYHRKRETFWKKGEREGARYTWIQQIKYAKCFLCSFKCIHLTMQMLSDAPTMKIYSQFYRTKNSLSS